MWQGTSYENLSSFGGYKLKLFIQFTFKIFRGVCWKSCGSESGQETKDVDSARSANYTWANLGLPLPWAWKGSSRSESWVEQSCGFSLGESIAHRFHLIEHICCRYPLYASSVGILSNNINNHNNIYWPPCYLPNTLRRIFHTLVHLILIQLCEVGSFSVK